MVKPRRIAFLLMLVCCVLSTGCATRRQMTLQQTIVKPLMAQGNVSGAVAALERGFGTRNNLYYLEYGELASLLPPNRLDDSTQALLRVDTDVNDWSLQVQNRITKAASNIGGYLIAEGMSNDYILKDYEVPFLSYRLATNHLLANRWDLAMVEARKIADREQIIANAKALVDKELRSEAAAKSTSVPQLQEIRGYPLNILSDPQVLALKNSYQSAAAHYLAGFIYESQGEIGLAAPGYRNAIELRPTAQLLQSSLANLDNNIANPSSTTSDTLFIIETGSFPNIMSRTFSFPVPTLRGITFAHLALPVIEDRSIPPLNTTLQIGGQTLQPEEVTRVDLMGLRWLRDAMPLYVWRAISRAVTSVVLQEAAYQGTYYATRGRSEEGASFLAALAHLLTGSMLTATDTADVRHWSTLPASIRLARAKLPLGPQVLSIGAQQFSVNLRSRYSLVYVRQLGNHLEVRHNGLHDQTTNH